jgi:hypothetical protein
MCPKKQTAGQINVIWHLGLQNALDPSIFYNRSWPPRLNGGVQEKDTMQLFPDGGLKFTF